MLLNILQYTGQPTKQRTILSKMPVMLRLRNVARGLYEGFLNRIILGSLVFCVYSLRKLLPLFCLPLYNNLTSTPRKKDWTLSLISNLIMYMVPNMENFYCSKKQTIWNIDFDVEKMSDFNEWAKSSFASQVVYFQWNWRKMYSNSQLLVIKNSFW